MSLPDSLKKEIKLGDVYAARAMVLDCLRDDLGMLSSRALLVADFAAECFPNLYEPDDGLCPQKNPRDCDKSDWDRLRGLLRLNFSREKVKFLTELSPLLPGPSSFRGNCAKSVETASSNQKRIQSFLLLVGFAMFIFLVALIGWYRYHGHRKCDMKTSLLLKSE